MEVEKLEGIFSNRLLFIYSSMYLILAVTIFSL